MPWGQSNTGDNSVFSPGKRRTQSVFSAGASPVGARPTGITTARSILSGSGGNHALDEFLAAPFVSPPPGANLKGTSSLQRGFPERIGGDLMQQTAESPSVLHQSVEIPAKAAAQPVAIFNTVTGGKVANLFETIGQQVPLVKGGLDAAAWGIERAFSLPAAIMNHDATETMAKIWMKPNDTVITPELLESVGANPKAAYEFQKNGLPVLGWLGITGEQMTVGDLKAELQKRKFLQDPETGQDMTWGEWASRVNGDWLGSFSMGHASVNENAVSDFLLQMGGQVAEIAALTFVTGGVAGVARMAGLLGPKAAAVLDMAEAASGAGQIAKAAGTTGHWYSSFASPFLRATGRIGDGAVKDFVADGVIKETAEGIGASAAKLAVGDAASATWKGAAKFMRGAVRAVTLPDPQIKGKSLGLLGRYLVGQTNLRIMLGATEGATSLAQDYNIAPGWMSDIHDFTEAVMNDTTVSDDALFATIMAFKFPVRGVSEPILAPVGKFVGKGYENIGRHAFDQLKREYGPDVVERMGGPEEVASMLDRMAQDLTVEKFQNGIPEGIRGAWGNATEASFRMSLINGFYHAASSLMLRTGKIRAGDLIQRFRDIHERPSRTVVREDGVKFHEPIFGKRGTKLSNDVIIERWNRYQAALKIIKDPFVGVHTAVLARASRMTIEELDAALNVMREAARLNDGMLDSQFVRDLFYRTPGMLDDINIKPDDRAWMIKHMNPAHNEPLPLAEAEARLASMRDFTPSRDELWHELDARDAAANKVPDVKDQSDLPELLREEATPAGALDNGVVRNIHDAKSAERFQVEADGEIRTLKKELEQQQSEYRSTFSKRGKYKPSQSDGTYLARAPEIDVHMRANEAGFYSTTHARERGYTRGYNVPGQRVGVVEVGDHAGYVAAARAIRTEYGGADMMLVHGDTPGLLDVYPSWHHTTEANARAAAAEIGGNFILDASKPITPTTPYPVTPIPQAAMLAKAQEIGIAAEGRKITPEQIADHIEVMRATAEGIAGITGGDPVAIFNSLEYRPDSGKVAVKGDVLFQKEVEPLFNVMEQHGHGASGVMQETRLADGTVALLPTGKGKMTLADAWIMKLQGLHPNDLTMEQRIDFYRRVFEAQKRPINGDPVDALRRASLSMMSAQNPLANNEIGQAVLSIRSMADIKRIAHSTQDQLVKEIMAPKAGIIGIGAMVGRIIRVAKRLEKDPTALDMRPGETPQAYLGRLVTENGFEMKTANFAAMLSDPAAWPIPTVDVHMVRSILDGELSAYLKPGELDPALVARYRESLKKNGKYPQPESRQSGGKRVYEGSDYQQFADAISKAMDRKYGEDVPFGYGGKQWMAWDEGLQRLQPHTSVWPETSSLPKMKTEELAASKVAHKNANYFVKNSPVQGMGADAIFFQRAEGARGTIKGYTEFPEGSPARAVVRLLETADISTLTHETWHGMRRQLPPELLSPLEQHYGVKNGKWLKRHEERGARDFERYMRDGKAPTPQLESVFARMANYLKKVYAVLKGSPIENKIAPEVREVFDRMLGKPQVSGRIELTKGGPSYSGGIRPVPPAEYAAIAARGHEIIQSHQTAAPIEMVHLNANRTKVINDAYNAAQAEWGGITYNPRTGEMVAAKPGVEGPYASSVAETVSISAADAANKTKFKAAFNRAVKANEELLSREGYYLGVFHDASTGKVEFDVSLLSKTRDEAIAVQTAAGRTGGAYDFTTGNGVWGVSQQTAPIHFTGEEAALLVQREASRAAIAEKRARIRSVESDIKEVRKRAKMLRGRDTIPNEGWDGYNSQGLPKTNLEDVKRVNEYIAQMRQEYPEFEVVPGPRLMNLYTPNRSVIQNLMVENSATANALFSWGPVSKMGLAVERAIERWTRPVRGSIEGRDTTSRIYEVLEALGAEPKQIDDFLSNVHETLTRDHYIGVGSERIPLHRGMNGLSAGQLRDAAVQSLGHNDTFVQNFVKRYGGEGMDRIWVPISESYNPAIRAIQRKIEAGGKVNRLQRLFESGYDAYHTSFTYEASHATHMLAKFFYPVLRFTANPLYHIYNATEADIMAVTQDGLRTSAGKHQTQYSGEVFKALEKANPQAYRALLRGDRRAMELYGSVLDAAENDLLRNATLEQSGATFGGNARRSMIIERQMDVRRPETILDTIGQFAHDDPALSAAVRRHGGGTQDVIDGLTRDIYGVDATGAKNHIRDVALGEVGMSPSEYAAMQPIMDKIAIDLQMQFDDLFHIHVGNVDRSRLERVVNSYWLYWPASYMIKANRWMFRVLTEGAFGFKSNLGGAWTLDQLSDYYHRRYVMDDNFRRLVDDNKDLEFALSQILPVVPWSDGVALNRMTRYVGGMVGLWPQYTNFDPLDVAGWTGKMSAIGPLYSGKLASNILKELGTDLNWKGGPNINIPNPLDLITLPGEQKPAPETTSTPTFTFR